MSAIKTIRFYVIFLSPIIAVLCFFLYKHSVTYKSESISSYVIEKNYDSVFQAESYEEAVELWAYYKSELNESNKSDLILWLDFQKSLLEFKGFDFSIHELQVAALQEFYFHIDQRSRYESWLREFLKKSHNSEIQAGVIRVLEWGK